MVGPTKSRIKKWSFWIFTQRDDFLQTYFFCLLCRGLFFRLLTYMDTHTHIDRSSLEEGSARRRDIPDNTQHSKRMNIHASGGIGTRIRSKSLASEPRLRQRGYRYWHFWFGGGENSFWFNIFNKWRYFSTKLNFPLTLNGKKLRGIFPVVIHT